MSDKKQPKETKPLSIHQRMAAIARQIASEGIGKTRQNQQQRYNFRGIDDAMNSFAKVLAEHHVFVVPKFTDRNVTERHSKNGGLLLYVDLQAEFTFTADTGESVTVGPFYGEAMDSADKATNKAMAVAFKYCLFQTFCVPLEPVVGGDPDMTTAEVGPDPAADWFEKIEDAANEDELKTIGEEIKGTTLNNDALRRVREAFSARMRGFRAAA